MKTKIQISELFDTGQEILSFDEFDSPASMDDLQDVPNVTIDGKLVCVDGEEGFVRFSKIQHPSGGGGSMYVCYFDRL